jgi:plastocyanin
VAASSLAAVSLALAAPAQAVNTAVDINLFSLNPADIAIDQGDTVTWRWVGADKNHDVVAYPGEAEQYDSHPGGAPAVDAPPGGTFAHTFTIPGNYRYFCSNHSNMQGTVAVRKVDVPVGQTDGGTAADGTPTGQLAKPKGCISQRNFRIRIRQPRGERLRSASVTLNGRPVPVTKRDGRFTAPVDLRGFSSGTYEVRVTARTADGDTLRGTRKYRTCAAKLASAGLPRL